jgi:hypothetical protein
MMNLPFWSVDRAAGLILVLSTLVQLPGLIMFWLRAGHKGGAPRSPAHYAWERTFIAAWAVLSAVGFVLLRESMQNGPGQILAVAGSAAYFFGSVLLATAEILSPAVGYGKIYRLAASYVVIAFLAQAVLGVAVIQSGLVGAWIGWASIVWNIAWLVILPLISRRDIYFPILHSLMPLVAGIALLLK